MQEDPAILTLSNIFKLIIKLFFKEMGIATYSAKLTTCDVTSAFLLLRYMYHLEAQQRDSRAAWEMHPGLIVTAQCRVPTLLKAVKDHV